MVSARPATQLEALRAALVGCGFLLSGEREPDRIGLSETAEGIDAWLELDCPDDPIQVPCAFADLMAGVALRISGPAPAEDLKWAKHALMWRLYRAGFWLRDEAPCANWQDVVLLPEEMER
jgi:hypothetical protein